MHIIPLQAHERDHVKSFVQYCTAFVYRYQSNYGPLCNPIIRPQGFSLLPTERPQNALPTTT